MSRAVAVILAGLLACFAAGIAAVIFFAGGAQDAAESNRKHPAQTVSAASESPPPPQSGDDRNALLPDRFTEGAWLPTDAVQILHVRVAEAWNTRAVEKLREIPEIQRELTAALERVRLITQLLPEDLETLTSAARASLDHELENGATRFLSSELQQDLFVIRTTIPVDENSLALTERGESFDYRGRKLVRLFNTGEAVPPVVLLPNARTIVFGNERDVKKGIDHDGRVSPQLEFLLPHPDCHLAVMFAGGKGALRGPFFSLPVGGLNLELTRAVSQHATAGSWGVKLADGLEYFSRYQCANADGASQLRLGIEQDLEARRRDFPSDDNAAAPILAELVESLLRSAHSFQQDGEVLVAASVNSDTVRLLGDGSRSRPVDQPAMSLEEALELVESTRRMTRATNDEQIPEGIEAAAWAQWASPRAIQLQPAAPASRLDVFIQLTGGAAATALRYGRVRLTDGEFDTGEPLVPGKTIVPTAPARLEGSWTDIQRDTKPFRLHPEDGLRASVEVSAPKEPVRTIRTLAGTLSLRIADQQQIVTLNDISQPLPAEGLYPDLNSARVRIAMSRTGLDQEWVMTVGDEAIVRDLVVIDKDGQPLQEVAVTVSAIGRSQVLTIGFPGAEIPPGIGLQFTLHTQLHEIEVPFQFEDLPVSPRPDELRDEGREFEVVAANQDEIPEGLQLQAQAYRDTGYRAKGPTPVIRLAIDVTGPAARQSIGYGLLKLDAATLADGTALNRHLRTFAGDPSEQILVQRGEHEIGGQLKEGLRILMEFDHPDGEARQIDAVHGSFVLVAAESTERILLPGILAKPGRMIVHPALKAADVRLTARLDSLGIRVEMRTKEPALIGQILLVDPVGLPLPWGKPITTSEDHFIFRHEKESIALDEVGLEVQLNHGVKRLSLPFRFENLQIREKSKGR